MSYKSDRERWVYARAREGWPLDAIKEALRCAGIIRRAHDVPGSYAESAVVDAIARVMVMDGAEIATIDAGTVRIGGEVVPAAGWRRAQKERMR